MIFTFDHVTVEAEYDGDTFHALIDLGCDVFSRQRIRMRGVSAIELDEPRGPEARDLLAAMIPVGTALRLVSHRKTYDRLECDVLRYVVPGRPDLGFTDINAAAIKTLREHGLEGGR